MLNVHTFEMICARLQHFLDVSVNSREGKENLPEIKGCVTSSVQDSGLATELDTILLIPTLLLILYRFSLIPVDFLWKDKADTGFQCQQQQF